MEEPKHQKIKNQFYREFLDKGVIKLLDEDVMKSALTNLRGKNIAEKRAFLIALYYSGARPNEILRLRAKDITKDGSHVVIQLSGSKRGLPRPFRMKHRLPFASELYKYANAFPAEYPLFYNITNTYMRKIIKKDGSVAYRKEISNTARHIVVQAFSGIMEITPYYLRHNRFSKLIKRGLSVEDIMFLKGSRTLESVRPYIHMSEQKSKKIAGKVD